MSRKILEKSNFGKKNNKQNVEKASRKRKGILLLVWGTVIFVVVLSYPFFKSRQTNPLIPSTTSQSSGVRHDVKLFRIQHDPLVSFKSFIIPFEEHGKFTYISLSISFELPNKELMAEMDKKNAQIRGIIYSTLSKNINILKNISSLEKLKALIKHRVNGVLAAGKVNEPIITDFSTV